MKKGALIGKGMTAEVYEWGKDKVLKLYFNKFGEDWVQYEAKIGTAVHEAGVPSPEVFDIVDVNGRKGIVFQRITGSSMAKHLMTEPWNLYSYTRQLAGLQFKIHQCPAYGLPSQTERYAVRINSSNKILGSREQKILNYIDSLPDGSNVCHGDLHFNNIIVSGKKLIPIDWTNAYRGNPLGDVARTCLMMSSPAKPPGVTDLMMTLSRYPKWLAYTTYINEYIKLSDARFENIDAWILPTAAAKLRDRIPGEEKWLMDTIDRRLERLGY